MEENKEKVEGQEEQDQQQETSTFTQDEVNKMIQSETDKRVTSAIKTAQDKWQQEYEAKLEQTKTEAEKLAKMSEAERLQADFNKQKEAFESEKKQYMKEKLELQTVKELSAIGLPTDFSGLLMADSAEAIKANIETFKLQWEQAIEKAVNEKLQGTTPKTATQTGKTVTKEQFSKMNYQQKMEIYNTDIDLYNQLKG